MILIQYVRKAQILTHNHSMTRILIIGCGDIALRAIPLLTRRYKIYALVRNKQYFEKLRALKVLPILGDLDDRVSLQRITGIADTVLHLAPPPNDGSGDARTQNLLSALAQGNHPPRRLIYISTSGVYGDCGGALVDETRALNPKSARAQRRVAAEKQIRNWAKHNGVHASILRVPGIYAADRLPVQRIQQGTPAIIAAEDSYSNHIHADDLVRCIVAAVRHAKPSRAYNTSDDSALQMGEYFDLVADAYYLPRPPRVSRIAAQHMLSPMMLSFVNESRRLKNARMKRELKVHLRYETVREALLSFNSTSL